MSDHDCQGSEPFPSMLLMSDDELRWALEAELRDDPYAADWPMSHRGRRLREEMEHRRLARNPEVQR